MSCTTDQLNKFGYHKDILSENSFAKNTILINDENFLDQLIEKPKPSDRVYGNVRSGAPIVICYGPLHSSLRTALIEYLTVEDITLIVFSVEDHLWQWLNSNSSLIVASLILQSADRIQELIRRSHAYPNVRSILVRCASTDLTGLQTFSRIFSKVDGVFSDDTRLMIKLVADLTLFSEELGDRLRENQNNEIGVQRNYDRALKLCVLVQKL